MKKITTTTKALILILALATSSQLQAITQYSTDSPEKDKKHHRFEVPVLSVLAEAFELSSTDLAVLQSQLDDVKIITLTYAEKEMDITLDDETLNILGMQEDYESRRLDDWMFKDLIAPEESNSLESWMFADNYYEAEYENSLLEDWMFEELLPAEEEVQLDKWMFTELVPEEEQVALSDWMFDTEYFNK